jgi:acetylornithine deacetylase/succinyl-diaminopimelate desuccinylase-like protein
LLAILYNEGHYRPEFVVSTEPTDGGIYRGQRGRMEIRVEVKGISCHGSAPERGDKCHYKISEICLELRNLNNRLAVDPSWARGR